MQVLRTGWADFESNWRHLCARNQIDTSVDIPVSKILASVAEEGAKAVLRWSAEFDETRYTDLSEAIVVPDKSWLAGVDQGTLAALKMATKRINEFHKRQLPKGFEYQDEYGNTMGNRWTAVQRAGLYVPGGKAAYPTSVLMNALPAKVAGVDQLVMVTPPGFMKPEVKAAAFLAGVDQLVMVGGIQAVGLLAYGAGSIEPVDVIVGPGNKFVAAAKRLVYGQVNIDMIAGPSEILVLADGSVPANWVASDLLSQAEHDEDAACGLICDNADYLNEVVECLQQQAEQTPRSGIALASLENAGFAVLAKNKAEMIELSNRFAPEHLELAVSDPQKWMADCRSAGSIFAGAWTPEATGDYISGPNHVLPTAGTARFYSPLGVDTFMKRTGWMQWTPEGVAGLGDAIVSLAESEELTAHADSIRVRMSAARKASK